MTDSPEKSPETLAPESAKEAPAATQQKVEGGEPHGANSGATQRSENSDARPTRREVRDAKDLLLAEVPSRADQADDKLRAMLTGSVLFDITDTSDKYLCTWTDKKLSVVKGGGTTGDCVIKTTERNLMRVYNGSLNAQIAMISGKIAVSGQTNLGIYFFNLISPRAY